MKTIKINGADVPTNEALSLLKKESFKVTKLTLDLPAPTKPKKEIQPNSEGFAIPKAVISELCRSMDRLRASQIKYTLSGSPYILKRNLIITIKEPSPSPTGIKRIIKKMAEWILEKVE